jgi:peptidoglycan/LPS O-acetylase OafA/YrhL
MLAVEIGKPDLATLGTWGTGVVEVAALFCIGALVGAVPRSIPVIVATALASMLIGNAVSGWRILFALAVVTLGHARLPSLIRPSHDISYGLYLYAFPCQQIAAGITTAFWPSLAIAAALALALACLSCILIEQPALKLKSKVYRSERRA